MGDLLNAIISGAKAFGKAVGDAAGSIGQAVVGAVVSGVQSVAAILVSGVRAIVGAFVAGVVSLVSIATGIAGAAIGFVSKLIGEIVQVGGNLLQGFINTISPPIIDSAVIEVTLHGSHPRPEATAMSIAHVTNADRYRDSGQRYLFRLLNGRAQFATPDAPWHDLDAAVSYDNKRKGKRTAAPNFDMIAANAGRAFAKETGKANFYFTMLEPMFRRNPDAPRRSVYFKLDPEQGLTSDTTDLKKPFADEPADHPAVVRFPLFCKMAEAGGGGNLAVNVDANLQHWHLVDSRPPYQGGEPPAFSHFPQPVKLVRYRKGSARIWQHGLPIVDVLDIGAGHEHWHERDCKIYGGEIDSLDGPGLPPVLIGRDVYRFFNGPVDDKGGFIDGTANYYVLAKLRDDVAAWPQSNAYGILWMDEQAVFTERWRLLHPDDCQFGLLQTLVPSALVQYLQRTPAYEPIAFDRTKYWCPFRDGLIRDDSRMAVSRQVIIVSGLDPSGAPWRLYSINFSFGTCDRTWRWRDLPPLPAPTQPTFAQTAAAVTPTGPAPVPPGPVPPPPTVPAPPEVPQLAAAPIAFGLREDMTLYVYHRGPNRQVRVSYQYYLPCDCRMAPDGEGFKLPPHQRVPLPTDLASLAAVVEMMRAQVPLIEVPNGLMPAEPYKHGWNVLPAPVWEYVHKHYSHFGCYENSVNWRSQFYLVDLPDGLPGWISEDTRLTDPDGRLTIRQPTLDWRVVNALLEGNPLPADVTLAQDQIANFNLLIASLVQSLITGVDLRTQLLALLDLLTKAPFSLEIHRDGLFEPGFRLKLLHRPPLGYILVHWDKRDDDLLPFRPFLGSGDTASIEAILHGPHGEMVPVVLRQWQGVMFPPAVHEVEVTLSESIVTIRFRPAALSNGAPDLKANIWRVRLGALTNEGGTLGPATVLLSVLRHEAFQPEATDSGWQCFDWNLENESPSIAQRARQACTKHGQQALATSVWFEDVVGHVRIADCTRFIAEG